VCEIVCMRSMRECVITGVCEMMCCARRSCVRTMLVWTRDDAPECVRVRRYFADALAIVKRVCPWSSRDANGYDRARFVGLGVEIGCV
jgi:hypothetical protein